MRLRDVLWLVAGAAGAAAGAALVHRLLTERWRLTVSRATHGIKNLPPDLEGLVLVHLSDFHFSSYNPIDFLRKTVQLANRQKPDAIVLTGDYADKDNADLAMCAGVLGELSAPLGVYAVLGNHDYDVGAEETVEALGSVGIRVLRNEKVALGERDGRLWLVGLDDTATHREEFSAAFEGIPADEPVILLSHSPDLLDRSAEMGVEIVLSGHTHGGQVRLPLIGAPHAPSLEPVRPAGTGRRANTRIHVSRGIGTTMYPIRFNCPPEVGVLTLRRAMRCGGAVSADAKRHRGRNGGTAAQQRSFPLKQY
jgi:predicted MPP superfamily phosphohydrolase